MTRDVTEQRASVDALRRSEERFRVILNQIPAIVWTTDKGLRITSSVGSGLSALHQIPDQSVGEKLSDILGSAPGARLPIAAHHRALRGKPSNYEYTWHEKNYQVHVEPLRDSNDEVIGCIGMAIDMSDRKTVEEALRQSNEQLRTLSSHTHSVREEERTRVAREIHDELGQMLTALKMDLTLLASKAEAAGATVSAPLIIQELQSMSGVLDDMIRSVRRIATELRPEVLDHLDLRGAMEWQLREFQSRTGIRCRLVSNVEEVNFDRDRATAVFRIFQETLTNIARHANAHEATIHLNEEAGYLLLEVQDDGVGIPQKEIHNPNAWGLVGMSERALLLGGSFNISGIENQGTQVTLRVPMDQPSMM